MSDRDRLLRWAPLLWGSRWQTAMAEERIAGRRSLARYVSGTRSVPPKLLQELRAALEARMQEIRDALAE